MPPDNMPRTWLQLARRDLGSLVIHWTKAVVDEARPRPARRVLDQILKEACLRGGNGFIRGSHTCVCFTEAPLAEMVSVFASAILAGEANALRYEPFGVGVPKEWLFQRGGRPVIYQCDAEYDRFPNEFRWRHCRYEPPDIDFTWEREWRIPSHRLDLHRAQAWVFVPTAEMAHYFGIRRPGWRTVPLELFGLPNLPNAARHRKG